MPSAGFEPTIPASEWSQTHALERAVTGIGMNNSGLLFLSFFDRHWVSLNCKEFSLLLYPDWLAELTLSVSGQYSFLS